MADSLKEKVSKEIDARRERLIEVSMAIHDEPELGHQEFKASALLASELEGLGFEVEKGTSGLSTAFKAVRRGKGEGPTVAIIAEYDALPELGHACGHNIIAASALGAGAGMSAVMDELDGTVIVFGTPAEEGYAENAGGKVLMIDEITAADVAIMIHPSSKYGVGATSLARESFMISFKGKAAHAGAIPERGINALEGVLLTYQGINALRQHLMRDIRIHGVIRDGGAAPNIVPETASAHFYVRAPTLELLKEILEKVKNCARGAALATGAEVSFRQVANTYANKVPNMSLGEAFKANLEALGAVFPEAASERPGASTDFGTVSQAMPAATASVFIGENVALHSYEATEVTASETAHEAVMISAKGLAHTAIDVLTDADLLRRIKEEHSSR
ncbi:MAG: M20 family metallopeptidase [Candidatus Bathyarchaeota archaeon]|nr:M20 family metallopeptidase [Candidatus Bathyarchaeota archaeon]